MGTNNCPLLKSPTLALNLPTRWSNVIPDTVNIWPAVCCTEVMLSPRTSTPPSLPSKPSEPSNSSTGAPPVSRSVSTTNHPPLSQVVTWPRSNEPSVCCPTPLPSLKLGLDLTTSSILCTPSELSSTGMSVKVWKKVNFLKPEKIWLLWRRIMKKLVSTLLTVKVLKKVKTNSKLVDQILIIKRLV